ncbi:MAG: hypothetical protein JNJ54_00365 [Myxococcaceae bacterium]|nr:hypothetical protein [Myxococcaceae bacterium]
MPFELWSRDLFDRESAPFREATFARFADGLTALWRKVLDEVIQDDGRPTFTDFSLEGEGRVVWIPRDPFENPVLAELRRRARVEADFVERLVTEHQSRFGHGPVALDTLALALTPLPSTLHRAVVVIGRQRGLAPRLTLGTTGGWQGPGLTITATWSRAGVAGWRLELSALDGPAVLTLEEGGVRLEAPPGGAGEVLRDALLEAGVLAS